jgi:dipeptidyl aminopeptidase/acylaminoacyl peptidase
MTTLLIETTLAFLAATLAADDTFTPKHVAKLRSVNTVDISADGSAIAFTLTVPRKPWEEASGNAWEELHVVDRKGVARPFVTGEVNVSAARFSRDGRSITYLAKRNGEKNASLYRIPIDGGESTRILSHESSISGYAFSPDEKRVAFLAQEPEPERTKKAKEKGFDAEIYEEQLRFTRVWIAELGGDAKPKPLQIEGNASELSWSPNGNLLGLAIAPTPLVDDEYMSKRVRVVDADTGAIVGKYDNGGKLGAIRIAPDGKHVAFIAGLHRNDPHDGTLFVTPIALENVVARDLFPNAEFHVASFAWRDADTITCLIDERVHTSLETIDIDGSDHRRILERGKYVLGNLALAADGTAVTTSETWRHPKEVMVVAESGGAPTHLTDHNTWISELRLAKQEVVTHPARDGLALDGILVRPLDEVAGKRYPLVLAVHGGPEAHVRDGFVTSYSNPGQMLAAKGVAVFYPNYRGSTGRGVAFSMLGQGDEAGKEFDDLIDAVDHFVKIGLADEKKIGVTGGSYGGYATAWCSTKHSARFAAGVMFVGISDLISKAGTTDIPTEMNEVHSRKEVFSDWNFFLERSPIRWVEQARTPLLILHGKEDPRVHPAQSLELYRQLKIVGKTPVRLVWYPGEGHGNRKSASRYDYSLRMLQWFEHYLVGPGGAPPTPELDYGFEPAAKN